MENKCYDRSSFVYMLYYFTNETTFSLQAEGCVMVVLLIVASLGCVYVHVMV